jgi:hypothetical protein
MEEVLDAEDIEEKEARLMVVEVWSTPFCRLAEKVERDVEAQPPASRESS